MGVTIYIEVDQYKPVFVQDWYFESNSLNTRSLALDDYREGQVAIEDDSIQIFEDNKFQVWMQEFITTSQPTYPNEVVSSYCKDLNSEIFVEDVCEREFIQNFQFENTSNTRDLSLEDYVPKDSVVTDDTVHVMPHNSSNKLLSCG